MRLEDAQDSDEWYQIWNDMYSNGELSPKEIQSKNPFDNDNPDSFDSWVEEYRKILLQIARDNDRGLAELSDKEFYNLKWTQVEPEGTVPSDNDPRLKVYEDYLNNRKENK